MNCGEPFAKQVNVFVNISYVLAPCSDDVAIIFRYDCGIDLGIVFCIDVVDFQGPMGQHFER